jgi:hypothetical protein
MLVFAFTTSLPMRSEVLQSRWSRLRVTAYFVDC